MSFGSRVSGVTLASGYELPFGPLLLTPIARFLYQHTGVKALSEEGALGANLQFGSSSVNTVLTFLGADAQYAINTLFGAIYQSLGSIGHINTVPETPTFQSRTAMIRLCFRASFAGHCDFEKLFRSGGWRHAAVFRKSLGLHQL